jgi:CRP/FNR family transcriptional regulator, cyclic AMP receptor protein
MTSTRTDVTETADLLHTVPLFQGLPESAIEAIADLARPATFPAGAQLVRQGDLGDTLIIIVSGRASVDQDGTVIRELGNGDFLGEISLIDGGPRTATVTAVDAIDSLTIDREGFDKLMNKHPAVRLGLVMALSERLRQRAPSLSD